MGYYNFKSEDAWDFAHYVHAKVKPRGHELVFESCPYCRDKKDRYKFAINLNTGAYNCLRASCSAKGSFINLARDFNFQLPEVQAYLGTDREYKHYSIKHIEIRDPAIKYLKSRDISEDICRKYDITTQKDKDNILVIPFRDDKGEVQCIKYRKTDFNPETDRNKEWFEPGGKAILFGMNQCDMAIDTLVLTEGQLDALALATAGIKNPVSVPTGKMGTTWIPHCWDFVNQFQAIIVFGDNEHGHITLVDMVRDRFPNILVKVVREEDYKGCKDANDILRHYGAEQLQEAVNNAQPLPISQLVDVFDVKHVNVLKMDALPTRISGLDEVLTRGLYYGQVVLLTGNRGDGKSTFMQQIICNALDQDVKTFLYSGELPNYVVRNFTDTMLAGVHESELRQDMLEAMEKQYHGMLYLYDFNVVEHNEQKDVLKIAEEAIRRYGCRLVCLDNLMTLVSSANSDGLYQAQKEFVDRLVKLAKLYNVIVILVAHPRKRGVGDTTTFSNDDIAGTGDVANRVDVIMSYQRYKRRNSEEDDSKRCIWVTKNRLTGRLAMGDNAVKVQYEPRTRRIVDEGGTFNYDCAWRKGYDGEDNRVDLDIKVIPAKQEEIPF